MNSTSGSQRARNATRPRRLKALYARWSHSTFSCDIARPVSRSPRVRTRPLPRKHSCRVVGGEQALPRPGAVPISVAVYGTRRSLMAHDFAQKRPQEVANRLPQLALRERSSCLGLRLESLRGLARPAQLSAVTAARIEAAVPMP